MIMLAIAAVLGATLGLVFRTAVLAVAVALAATGSAQFGAMCLAKVLGGRAETSQLARSIDSVVGLHPMAMIPTLAAAGCGAAIAALMVGWADGRKQSSVFIPGDQPGRLRGGKRKHSPMLTAIAERPVHAVAENRIQRILKQ